jgi:PEP-CTERM motif
MPSPRLFALLALLCGSSLALAGPIPVKVRSFITPQAGQTPFDPTPGTFASEANFDMTPGSSQSIATFTGLSAWVTPSGTTPEAAKFVQREYFFVYNAEITDLNTGSMNTITVPGRAFANWVEGVDGGIYQMQTGVVLESPSNTGGLAIGSTLYTPSMMAFTSGPKMEMHKGFEVLRVTPDNLGAEVILSVAPLNVPEPGTIFLGVMGLLPLAGLVARRRAA